jgi:hypothetical protein
MLASAAQVAGQDALACADVVQGLWGLEDPVGPSRGHSTAHSLGLLGFVSVVHVALFEVELLFAAHVRLGMGRQSADMLTQHCKYQQGKTHLHALELSRCCGAWRIRLVHPGASYGAAHSNANS